MAHPRWFSRGPGGQTDVHGAPAQRRRAAPSAVAAPGTAGRPRARGTRRRARPCAPRSRRCGRSRWRSSSSTTCGRRCCPGGFIGVDVFFVISGFLITSLLLRRGRARRAGLAARFWARRARRILPAALLVLAVRAGHGALVPQTPGSSSSPRCAASTAYVAELAARPRRRRLLRAPATRPSPVQHYWSLSVEEQFYLVWPVLIAAGRACHARRAPAARRGASPRAGGRWPSLSLAYSIVRHGTPTPRPPTSSRPRARGSSPPAALLALRSVAARGRRARARSSWAGLAAIAVAAAGLQPRDAVPRLRRAAARARRARGDPRRRARAALVAGAAPARRGRCSSSATSPTRSTSGTGRCSSSRPSSLGRAAAPRGPSAILALTLLAAWLTKLLVEDPVRAAPAARARRPRWTFACAAAATVAVLAVTRRRRGSLRKQIRARGARPRSAARLPPALLRRRRARPAAPVREPRPAPGPSCPRRSRRRGDNAAVRRRSSARAGGRVRVRHAAGAPERHRRRSSATATPSHWRTAREWPARAAGAALSIARTGCPSRGDRGARRAAARGASSGTGRCRAGSRRHPEVDTCSSPTLGRRRHGRRGGRDEFAAQVDGYARAWRALPPTVKHIVVVRDTPRMRRHDGLRRARDRPRTAARPRLRRAARRSAAARPRRRRGCRVHDDPRVRVVDLTRYICDRRPCFPVIGGALVFKDLEPPDPTFATTLGPILRRAVDALTPGCATARARALFDPACGSLRSPPAVAGVIAFARPVAGAAQGPVLVVGDSLAVGLRPTSSRCSLGREVAWDARPAAPRPKA